MTATTNNIIINPIQLRKRQKGFMVMNKLGLPEPLIIPFIMLDRGLLSVTVHAEIRPHTFGTRTIKLSDDNVLFVETKEQATKVANYLKLAN